MKIRIRIWQLQSALNQGNELKKTITSMESTVNKI